VIDGKGNLSAWAIFVEVGDQPFSLPYERKSGFRIVRGLPFLYLHLVS
jgi:hypothetical protein